MTIVLAAASLALFAGVLTLPFPRSGLLGQRLFAALQILACLGMASMALSVLGGFEPEPLHLPLNPALPALTFGLDRLSAFFLLPIAVLGGSAACFDLGYLRQTEHPRKGPETRLFLGLLIGGMALVVLAKDGVAFLVAWEIMALAAFFLVGTDHEGEAAREASFVYLATTHLGTLALIALFCLLAGASGSFAIEPLEESRAASKDLLFLLALVGFGLKAGFFPGHFWLPPAHANAPSHVSAVMSGVMIKMGVYGIARMLWILPSPPLFWGETLLAIGAVSGLLGVAFAIGQHDLKRLLAYHSIENVGIIAIGMGLGLLGQAAGMPRLMVLGYAGGLLHVWNHGLFKGLLFLAAGSAISGANTREIDRLGGLGRAMPATSALFLVGAVAICGLPPLNGFVSEFLTYVGLLGGISGAGPVPLFAALGTVAMALIGAMALYCFTKVFGIVFLGLPRSEEARAAHESPRSMRIPMALLAALCFAIGLAPPLAGLALDSVISSLPGTSGSPRLSDLVPLAAVGAAAAGLLILVGIAYRWLRARRSEGAVAVGTWDCGYAGCDSPRIQYTAGSFAQWFVDLSRRWLLPVVHRSHETGLFPGRAFYREHVPDLVLDRLLRPAMRALESVCLGLRVLHRGKVQIYLLYVFLALVVLLAVKG
ncbi:MAG: proton-conducting transporter membrane subunit [Planctomycetota bacterium]